MSDRVLFVSGRCPHSKKVLIGIQQYPFLKPLFKVVNIDAQPYPNYVKSIPAILINNQVITGQTVFEYFGKLVEGKEAQEARAKQGQQTESDQGQYRFLVGSKWHYVPFQIRFNPVKFDQIHSFLMHVYLLK